MNRRSSITKTIDRCRICKKRLTTQDVNKCTCGGVFCIQHSHVDTHNCK